MDSPPQACFQEGPARRVQGCLACSPWAAASQDGRACAQHKIVNLLKA